MPTLAKTLRVASLALWCLTVAAPLGFAQSITGTLTGTVGDASGAVVPGANVSLINEGSGDERKTVTNSDGYFTIAAVPAGTYTLRIEAPGFQKYESKGVAFNGSDKRNVNAVMQVGTAAQSVEVVSAVDIITPVDSGEKASTLNTRELQDFSVVGRSAAEFIKILPGMGIAGTGVENRSNFTGEVIGINGNGDAGSQSALNGAYNVNGLPTNSLDITADGAHVSDPGCNCATPVNPNTDMIQEMKVMTSNFSAENSKGPAVINTIAKAGTRDFHGEGYFYARDYSLNANDWINNRLNVPQPKNKYFFPGGNIGGPVLVPGTNFNKNRDKLFFFTGFEYYLQSLDTGIVNATVPTPGMLDGNFSPAELAKLGTIDASGGAPKQLNSALYPNGIIPKSQIDSSGLALLKLLPQPNVDPNLTGGYNFVKAVDFDQNSWQWMSRVDYSISDNTKLFVRYNLQKEKQLFPVGLWWRNANQVPYPTPVVGNNQSQSVSADLTHVFSPTLTNEFVFGYTYIDFPNVFEDPSKVDRTKVGYNNPGLFHNGVTQIPQLSGGGEIATMLNPGGFEAGGSKGLFADKYLPTFSDNLSKVWGTHTLKFGAYYEYVINNQPANTNSNGAITENAAAGSNTIGNQYADLLTGRTSSYSETNYSNLHNEAYNTLEFFVQDNWKVTRRVTLELGIRISHFGQWYDRLGNGFAVWDPSLYNAADTATGDYTGFTWHKKNSKIPLSGFSSPALLFGPRFGVAYDIFGSGKTVLRGGWGRFYYHNSQFTTGLDVSAGQQNVTLNNLNLADIPNQVNFVGGVSAAGVDPNDDKTPYSDSYSFTISQRVPGASLLEVSYVGNQSHDLLNTGNLGTNVNAVPYGALFGISNPSGLSSGAYSAYRPFQIYGDLGIVQHNLYQNYNSLQITWAKQRGHWDIQANYTYGKNLGIVGGDQLNLNNDYGPLANDRRHIFNAAYSVEFGNPVKNNKFAAAAVNGWQVSGITQWQSGINLAANTGNNFNLNANNFAVNGNAINARYINGTDSVPLQPILTCNPTANLAAHQFVNANCFALPTTPGGNGPIVLPEIFGPAYFDTDLSLFKNFKIGESKKLQFRFSAYNFLNHALWSFRGAGNNLNLIFDPDTGKVSNPNFGVTTDKLGHRIVQLAVKFYF